MNRACPISCEEADVCDGGMAAYERAVMERSIPREATPACLLRSGLVASVEGEPDLVRPVGPGIVAARLLNPLEQSISATRAELARASQVIDMVERAYERGRAGRRPDIALIEGPEEVEDTLQLALARSRKEIITAHPGSGRSPEILAQVLQRDLPVLRRGVRKRVIYQHTTRYHAPTLEYIERIAGEGAEIRTSSELFDRLIIFDGEIAYVSAPSGDEHELVEICQPALVRYLTRIFELAWIRASPILTTTRREGQVVDDQQRAIMRMLVAGLTEDKIARELGMGRRTVAEHIRRISARLGSTSRAQLGYSIAISGVLDEDA